MWNIEKISGYNFASFEEFEYSFSNNCFIIQGENNSNDGQASNGSGKSHLLDAIAVALIGNSLNGKNLKDLVNYNNDANYLTLSITLYNSYYKKWLQIDRKVYNNTKPSELYIDYNGETPEEIISKSNKEGAVDWKDGNKYIIDLIGISREDLLNYYFISQNSYTPFFAASNKNKIEIISRFSKTDKVDSVIDELKSELSEKESEEERINSNIESKEEHIDQINQQIEEAKNDDSSEIVRKIDAYVKNKQEYKKYKSEAEEQKPEKEKEKKKLDEKYQELKKDLSEIDTSENDNKIKEKQKEIEDYESFLSELKKVISGEIECPNCGFHFSLENKEISVEEAKETKEETNKYIDKLYKEIDKLRSKNKEKEDKKKSIKSEIEEIEGKIRKAKNEIKDINDSIDRYDRKISDAQESIDHLEEEKNSDSVVKTLEKQIEDLESEKKELKEKLESIKSEKDKYNLWVTNFENFKLYLANIPIQTICNRINYNLESFHSDLSVNIEGFKRLKSGKIKEELNPLVLRNLTNPQEYKTFSGGEQVRLNIACDIAFQDIINNTSESGGLNFYANDEMLNSLDSLGISEVAKSLDKLNKTFVLISHSGSDLNYNNIIHVRKDNHISKIV